jgi:Fe-S cluster biogenesis protein NfuA
MTAQVEKVIDIIRPALQADGGDISLISVAAASGEVTVELHGACVSCPASTITMKAGVERILKDRVPGVQKVVQVDEALDDGTLVSF